MLACPLRTHLVKILRAQLPPNTVFGNHHPFLSLPILFSLLYSLPVRHMLRLLHATSGTNSHSLTRSDFLQVYREHCKYTRTSPYRPIEDQILLDSARSDEPFSRLDMSRVLRDSRHVSCEGEMTGVEILI